MIDISWKHPDKGGVCLNTDGAMKANFDVAGCGGLICDHIGK